MIFAVLVSGVASYIVYRLVSAQMAANAKQQTPQLVVASRNIEVGALLKDSDVKIVDWGGPVPPGSFTKVEEVTGRGVMQPIYQGEPLLDSRIAAKGAGAGLAATIPMGMRAVAVRVNDVVGVAGFVTPGMRVDILIAGNPPGQPQSTGSLSKTLLQNIEVLSSGTNIQKDPEGKPIQVPVVNLLVTPEQAEILSLASNEARIQLVLRNPTDKEVAKTPGTALAYLFSDGPKSLPQRATSPDASKGGTKRASAPKPVTPPPPKLEPPKPVIPVVVEVIHGAQRSNAQFAPADKDKDKDKEKNRQPEGRNE
jgi:pilus assembly protein CpaB